MGLAGVDEVNRWWKGKTFVEISVHSLNHKVISYRVFGSAPAMSVALDEDGTVHRKVLFLSRLDADEGCCY